MVARKLPNKLAAGWGSGDVSQNLGYESEATKAALYIRVSTDRQVEEGDSLEEQENELRKYCDYRNFRIHKIYIEKGKSGGNTNRPEYQTMLKDIQAKKINTLIVKKIDRLSRSLLDFEELMKMMSTHKVEFISIRESFDTTSAIGTAMVRIILVFAQLEREQTSERLRDVFSYRASQGMYNGGIRPYGYTSVNKELVPYPKEKQVVEIIVKQFLNCKSTSDTSRFLNENGYRGRHGQLWDKRRVQAILQNHIYTGKVKWYDQVFQGLHAAIISEKQFDQIQALFKQPGFHQEGKKEALLKKLLQCGHCQAPMTPSFTTNRHKKKYYYYRCTSTLTADKKKSTCLLKYVPIPIANEAVLDALLTLSEPKIFARFDMQVNQHNHLIESKVSALKEEKSSLELQLNTLKTKKDHFLDSLIASQFLSTERTAIQTRITELEAEEKQLKSKTHKLDFAITQQESERLDALPLKEFLILFKADHPTLTPKALQSKVRQVIDIVIYHTDQLTLFFKGFPWPINHPIPQNHHPGISP